MISSRDQLGREIRLNDFPKKIISLVPSISELIWDLGLQEELAGITKFCIHPEEMFRKKTRVGGTKNLNIELIKNLNPDLIIGNKEENTKEEIETLSELFPVWMSDVNSYQEAIDLIHALGKISDRENQAEEIVQKIGKGKKVNSSSQKVVYLIWHEPSFAVGKNTFIDDMLLQAGFINCIEKDRYPEITGEDLRKLNPDFLFLSSEPFPFSETHFSSFEKFIDKAKIRMVDGEMFSWYGSRMIKAFPYFQDLQNELKH